MADETKVAVEEVKNCPACKKVLKKSRKYYRNGGYYCNNTCFRTVQAKLLKEKADAKETADASAEGKG
jgi:hypothetical protein